MTEVATGILHNVGNVLNSVNIAAELVQSRIRTSKTSRIDKIVELMQPHADNLSTFLIQDQKGIQILNYLEQLARHLTDERKEMLTELTELISKIEHIKGIVAMQQNFARTAGVLQETDIEELLDDAIAINKGALNRHKINLKKEYAGTPLIIIDRHKILQILINLIRNAKYAMGERPDVASQLIIRASCNNDDRVYIKVIDNGVGISGNLLTKIFEHGFTTRPNGHGFGLHSASLAAKELGGNLTAESEGANKGATFTLEIPLRKAKKDDELRTGVT
jgi:signal transduction histidine kinase